MVMNRTFDEIFKNVRVRKPITIGVVGGNDQAVLETLLRSDYSTNIQVVLFGPSDKILEVLSLFPSNNIKIVDCKSEEESARHACEYARDGKVDVLMKGHCNSSTFLKAIVNKKVGLVKGTILTHMVLNDIPTYPKPLLTTDGGMILRPTLEQKRKMIEYGRQIFEALGYSKIYVGILEANERINLKVESSIEADILKQEYLSIASDQVFVEGPISLDLAISPKAVKSKGYSGQVMGNADMLIGSDIGMMNVLGKAITTLAQGKMAGVIMGASLPIIMTSRASDSFEKEYSLKLAMLLSQEKTL